MISKINFMKYLSIFGRWITRPESPVALGYFRVAMAFFCLFRLWQIRSSILEIYGQYGLVQWAITRGNMPTTLPHLGNIALYLQSFGVTADQTVYGVVWLTVISLIGLAIGIASRWMAVIAWSLDFLLMHASGGLLYGMDYFTHIGLFYCIIMPTGDALSLSAILGRGTSRPTASAGLTRKMLQIQMSIIYASSGLEKAWGHEWWNGESIWRSVTLPIFRQYDFTWLAWWPWLPTIAGWSVLLLECGYGFLVWRIYIRSIWIMMIIFMHLGIGLFMGMWLFALIMIILNLGAFGPELLQDLRIARGKRAFVE
jgi:hypothetical protein